jgi:predicted RNA methylase
VECTRDRLADLIGRDIAAIAHTAPDVSGTVVADLFAGSGNTLYWITQHVAARLGVGFELDDEVFALARKNMSIVSLGIELINESYDRGLSGLRIADDELLIVFVAPPWGQALHEISGLDLRHTIPPVAEVIDHTIAIFEGHKMLFATQVYERVNPDSLAEVTKQLQWSELKVYGINAPGTNHGLLLGTRGWIYQPSGKTD